MNPVEAIMPSILEDFYDIKLQYDVEDDEFSRAVKFSLAFTSSDTRADAYKAVFPNSVKPNRESAYYLKRKYVDSLVNRMYAGNNLMYSDKRNVLLQEMYVVAMDDGHDVGYKNKIDAAKTFLENTKMAESIVVDHTFNVDDSSKKAMDAFMITMEAIASGKIGMMSADGEVIDVKEIE